MSKDTATPAQPTSCREALAYLAASTDLNLTAEQKGECQQLATFMATHPILGLWMQQGILHAYMTANADTDISDTVDWPTILQWLVTNLPAILQMLLSFLTLFGG